MSGGARSSRMACGARMALPMVVLNMGGEMVNILHQRLHAQKVGENKANAVLHDVILTMYAPKFIEELFQPQDMYSDKATREIFCKLAHSSIMRLNETSMDKLFDLITMGFKYQVLSCGQPQQLLQITLNHLMVLKGMVLSPRVMAVVDMVIETTVASYRHLDVYGWLQLKHSLLDYLQDQHVKISLFLQYRVQLTNGTLVLDLRGKVPYGVERPGLIRYFGPEGQESKVVSLPMASAEGVEDALTSYLDFDSPMGTNIYAPSPNGALDPGAKGIRTQVAEAAADAVAEAARLTPEASKAAPSARFERDKTTQGASAATAGLNLLASLVGGSADDKSHSDDAGDADAAKERGKRRDSFKINLFPENPFDAAQSKDEDAASTINIDLSSSHTGCAKLLRDLDLSDDDGAGDKTAEKRGDAKGAREGQEGRQSEDKGNHGFDDLLELMDSTSLSDSK